MSEALVMRADLLRAGFQWCSTQFADGQEANNKLELDYEKLKNNPDLLKRVLSKLGALAAEYKPAFITGIPNGATGYARCLANMLGVECVYLTKDSASKSLDYAEAAEEHKVRMLAKGILVEDVINRRSSLERALALPGMADKIVAAVGVFDRGLIDERRQLAIPVQCAATLPIPAQLPETFDLLSCNE